MKVFSIILLAVALICSVQGKSFDSAEQFKIKENDEWVAAVENVKRAQDLIRNVLADPNYNPSDAELNDLRIAGPESKPDLETKLTPVRVLTIEGNPESVIEEDN